MEDVTSNITIAVMINRLSCQEVEYLWRKPIRVNLFEFASIFFEG